ncbi:MAG: hypothetical protein ABIB79_05470 [archaeon]
METIQVEKTDFNKILNTAEILIDEVDQVFQDEIVKTRIEDITKGNMKGKTQEDYNEYLRKRGINFN